MEVNKKKCKVCGEEKERILAGKFPNGRDKRWKQPDHKLWNGLTCGDCNVKASFSKMRKLRGSSNDNQAS